MTTSPPDLLTDANTDAVAAECIQAADWPERKGRLPARQAAWADMQRFEAKPGQVLLLQGSAGLSRVLVGVSGSDAFTAGAQAATAVPEGHYRVTSGLTKAKHYDFALGWLLAHYQFTRYKKAVAALPKRLLAITDASIRARAMADASATWLVRDLVNTPAEDMKPSDIEAAARALAKDFSADISAIVGDDLLAENFPTIHAVGRAADDAPRLIDIHWGNANDPKVTLVGKGVSFDSGGLNIKTGGGMRIMKKDMGGAAHVLGLAQRIMQAKLPVRLRVLIPAVENAISGNAFRPGDVITSRKGITIEIGNTDAEGRLILCDALALADDEAPEVLIDFATLTGAARVALGPDIAPMFGTDDAFVAAAMKSGETLGDPIWRMPLYGPYAPMLDSPVADTNNISDGGFAGCITAALFLQKFVTKSQNWSHFDVYAWSPKPHPGKPLGGDAYAIRAVFDVLDARFGGV